MGSYGIVYVDAWEDIGAGVCFIEGSYGCAENVLVRVDHRAEVGTVVEEGTDDQAQGHAGKYTFCSSLLCCGTGRKPMFLLRRETTKGMV